MTTYARINYRKIYEDNFGPIPCDDQGRTYHIHHIDGDHSNNDPSNLQAVSMQEHYDIHFAQGDWAACLRLARNLHRSQSEISELAKQANLTRISNGTHNLVGGKSNANKLQMEHIISLVKKIQYTAGLQTGLI